MMYEIEVGLSISPTRQPKILLNLETSSNKYRFYLTKNEAYDLARGLILMADLDIELKKRDPKTGKFRKTQK